MIDFVLTTKGVLNVNHNKRVFTVSREEPRFKRVFEICEVSMHTPLSYQEEKELTHLLDPNASIADNYRDTPLGRVEVKHGVVTLNGANLHNAVATRIGEFVKEGLPFQPLLNFLANIMANPSEDSRRELYDFMDRKGLPITPDGCFLAYKGVTTDLKDVHTRTFDNSPGQIHEMKREEVDPDRRRECSYGFHVGAFEYASSFGAVVMRVKVNPADAVAVPLDHCAQKLRTRRYEVLDRYDTDKGEMPKPLYGERGEDVSMPTQARKEEIQAAEEDTRTVLERVQEVIAIEVMDEGDDATVWEDDVIRSLSGSKEEDAEIEKALREEFELSSSEFTLDIERTVEEVAALIEHALKVRKGEAVPQTTYTADVGDQEHWTNQGRDVSTQVEPESVVLGEEEALVFSEESTVHVSDDGGPMSPKKRGDWYADAYNRDDIMDLAKERGIIQTKEEGRRLGKTAVCLKLAKADLKAMKHGIK